MGGQFVAAPDQGTTLRLYLSHPVQLSACIFKSSIVLVPDRQRQYAVVASNMLWTTSVSAGRVLRWGLARAGKVVSSQFYNSTRILGKVNTFMQIKLQFFQLSALHLLTQPKATPTSKLVHATCTRVQPEVDLRLNE